ncbi:gustatory receptor for sugar taste 61a-like [Toxorhynchites rutilus septentrionalis]|uniref:gustatory receptor for sugar taste 61a-like n=1 Tax=Toxorhynchites rutilus septentrionalis TaxID=329112 RepID=UPI00247B1EE1|nr:gustatory receptor for sugar taste 61a-like [Toxorhynchites rutilus septentrionalis]
MLYSLCDNRFKLWKKTKILIDQDVVKAEQNCDGYKEEGDFFHIAIAPVLLITQFFGVFPLSSVMQNFPEKLVNKPPSITRFISGIVIFGGFSISILSVSKLGANGLNIINVAEPIFFGISTTGTVLFWKLATQWKSLIMMWSETELTFLKKPLRDKILRRKIRSVATRLLLLGLVEHILSVMNNVSNLKKEIVDCNYNITDPVKYYSLKTFSTVFHAIPYNIPTAIYNEYVVLSMTLAWNFVDLFIMLVSIGLSTRFTQLNCRILGGIEAREPTSERFWEQIRLHYVSLCELTEVVNSAVSRLVFISYANDVYFICLQIMNASQELPLLINKVYFSFSFLFLLMRSFLMFWFSSQVQEASHEPCKLILRVPNEEYGEELQRVQMYAKRGVSLNGMGVFLVSRRILLTIASTIATYELVILAYRRKSYDQSNRTSCDSLQLF